ncbi:Uncharacterized conserved protein, tellurite resistance protein B (TerB) family [Gemmobacter aquatilis]|uniref:Uncharacterized conserved protein, tellurite resistance protein B (TerB) family n=1 Tax=Gemmobacter aquatilis TaxID=933059 RepID=A0A1H8EFA8_9RHOB|nr:TerB family tellurite resistance protein [Gemmobacter aquatilis]SEN17527.1 Uncharacterized conserved protein, tellurite resistance protein B (TerB) family [Gemmobacter aquatilis]
MFDTLLRRLLSPGSAPLPAPEAHLALGALLVRVARADGIYAPAEQARIDRVLARLYAQSPFAAAQMRAEAEQLETEAPDTVRFTRALKAAVPLEERAALVQGLWSVALADGGRADEEDQLLRLIANLLGLTDRESAEARQRAEREA